MKNLNCRLSLTALALLLGALSSCSNGSPAPPEQQPPDDQTPVATPPHVSSVVNDGALVTLAATDVNGDDITVTATAPAGFSVDPPMQIISGGEGEASFSFVPSDVFGGGDGTASFEVSDGNTPPEAIKTVEVVVPPLDFDDDTLYAIPLETDVNVGDPVTILVATGKLPNPLMFLTGVRVGAQDGINYEYGSYNIGTPGGARDFKDGFWTAMADDDTFLMIPENFIKDPNQPGPGGTLDGANRYYDFNITPIHVDGETSGSIESPLVDVSGVLFNIQVSFDEPGVYEIQFQDIQVVSRTYYMDHNPGPGESQVDLFWGDISNDYPGVPHTVTVH